MPQPRQVEELAAELLHLYERAWQRITADEQTLIDTWTGLRRAERLARLQELRVAVEQLMDHADQQALAWVNNQLPHAYLLGAAAAGVALSPWTQTDVDAIGVLVDDAYQDLLAATSFVRDSTKTLIRTFARQHIADKLIIGQTADQAAAELTKTLADQRITAVVYRDGSRHGLADYASVVVRTKTAEAYSTATLNSLDRAGVGFAECFDNPKCGLDGHDDPTKPNGHVYDVATAKQYVISHPRCVRSWGGRPDVRSATEARDARGSATPGQNEDQSAVAVSRQEAAIARALQRHRGSFSDRRTRVPGAAHSAIVSRRQARLARRETTR